MVDLPSKIYLTEHPDETAKNKYYRIILQNILDSIEDNSDKLSLSVHVVDRINRYKSENPITSWISALLGDPLKRTIDSVFLKMSTKVSKEVLGSWSKVFNRPATAKRIEITWHVDPTKDDLAYATFSVSDGESPYALSERSLGFRWFFSFLLFTRFGGSATKSNLFLFDEPAANLHARAQAELLDSFQKIINEGNSVVYSTHSNHMINPKWLSGAYIVENKAIDYESEGAGTEFSILPTLITATPYRRFVGEHGDRISYFQPVLERLQYIEPSIASSSPSLMVEGPSDFYAFNYVKSRVKSSFKYNIVPGGGAGSLDPIIGLFLGRSIPFVILLDDDSAGRKARDRYLETWGLQNQQVLTLGDLDNSFLEKKLEDLVSRKTKETIKSLFEGKNGKKQMLHFFSEIQFSTDQRLCEDTFENVSGILKQIQGKFSDLSKRQ